MKEKCKTNGRHSSRIEQTEDGISEVEDKW
jgi:hypothetical protein